MAKPKTKRLWLLTGTSIVVLGVATACWYRFGRPETTASQYQVTGSPHKKLTAPVQTVTSIDKTRYSLTDPTSLWVIVNKQHPLQPLNYVPADLVLPNTPQRAPGPDQAMMRAAAATALEQMITAAAQAGYSVQLQSAYRSYDYQVSLYNGYIKQVGQANADQESARPGYSEHQTGLAVDISNKDGTCTLETCYGGTPEGMWLAANAYKYGFLLRYPADKTAITGYEYEPWHFRYIGTDLSQAMYTQHIQTLEEFFGTTGGTSYK